MDIPVASSTLSGNKHIFLKVVCHVDTHFRPTPRFNYNPTSHTFMVKKNTCLYRCLSAFGVVLVITITTLTFDVCEFQGYSNHHGTLGRANILLHVEIMLSKIVRSTLDVCEFQGCSNHHGTLVRANILLHMEIMLS